LVIEPATPCFKIGNLQSAIGNLQSAIPFTPPSLLLSR
jgi:hypothetical protein